MNSQQDVIYGLMGDLEDALEKGFSPFGYYSVVKKDTVNDLLDRIYAALPDEIKEARALLKRKEELQYEAQQKSEKIIADAQGEANRLLSESEVLRSVKKEAEKIKEQVINECSEIKRKATEEADAIRSQAADEAIRIQDGSSAMAEQILAGLEQNLAQMQEIVKNGQVALEKRRMESEEVMRSSYVNQRPEYAQDFRMQ